MTWMSQKKKSENTFVRGGKGEKARKRQIQKNEKITNNMSAEHNNLSEKLCMGQK